MLYLGIPMLCVEYGMGYISLCLRSVLRKIREPGKFLFNQETINSSDPKMPFANILYTD